MRHTKRVRFRLLLPTACFCFLLFLAGGGFIIFHPFCCFLLALVEEVLVGVVASRFALMDSLVVCRVVGCVGSVDVDGSLVPSTLGFRPSIGLLKISLSCRNSNMVVCWQRCVALPGSFPCSACRRSAAANMILSPSEMVGAMQCAGYSQNVPVETVPPVCGSKKLSRR